MVERFELCGEVLFRFRLCAIYSTVWIVETVSIFHFLQCSAELVCGEDVLNVDLIFWIREMHYNNRSRYIAIGLLDIVFGELCCEGHPAYARIDLINVDIMVNGKCFDTPLAVRCIPKLNCVGNITRRTFHFLEITALHRKNRKD